MNEDEMTYLEAKSKVLKALEDAGQDGHERPRHDDHAHHHHRTRIADGVESRDGLGVLDAADA